MKLNSLYKRRAGGSVQKWEIEIEEDKYRVISGVLGGKEVVSKWTVCEGKNIGRANETTPSQQSLKEAQAKWQRRIEGEYHESLDSLDESRYIKPMLAREYPEFEGKIKFPVFSQPKLDGVRCIARAGELKSRTGKLLVSTPHILRDLSAVFDKHPEAAFDGELYCDKYKNNFEEIISAVRKTKPTEKDLEHSKVVCYHVYDMPSASDKPFRKRSAELQEKLFSAGASIVIVKTVLIDSQQELDAKFDEYLSQGYEGQMIRSVDGLYENKRSKHLIKRKLAITEEMVVVGFEEGKGNRSGMVGRVFLSDKDGNITKANLRGTHEYLTELLTNKEDHIGKRATLRHYGRTAANDYRFPVVIAIRDYE